MTPSASKRDLQSENRRLRLHGFGTNVARVLMTLIRWGGIVLSIWMIKDIALAWAGKQTLADISINARGNLELIYSTAEKVCADIREANTTAVGVAVLSLTLALAGLLYGRRQAALRRSVIQRLSPFEQLWERSIDASRSSSGIRPTGDTREDDE